MRVERADVVIVGASLGGVAAAIAAGEAGASVVMLEPSGWIGGQLTAQGVCTPDDTLAVETVGATLRYRTLRRRIREHYRGFRLSPGGRALDPFNPGSNWVTFISVEPRVAQRLLYGMLPPTVRLRLHASVQRAVVRRDRVRAVLAGGVRYEGGCFLDATDGGDLLPLCGAEHVVGAEGRGETGESDAPEEPRADFVQPFTFPFLVERRPRGENHTIDPPADYAELRASQQYHLLDGAMTGMDGGRYPWWTYRRVIAAANFEDRALRFDLSSVNTSSVDYRDALLPGASPSELARARRAALGYLYWLQTACPREDAPGERGYPELRLAREAFGTSDGIAPSPYVRESRRIRALQTVRASDILQRDQPGPRARPFSDAIAIGDYWLDIHHGREEPDLFLPTRPYQLPLDAFLPVRLENLLPASKNIGATHLAAGSFRVHSVEWAVGEAAGTVAAWCVARRRRPRDLHHDGRALRRLQRTLVAAGAPIFWWSDVAADHAACTAVQMLGVRGYFGGGPDLRFRPDDLLTGDEHEALETRMGGPMAWSRWPLTRADAALELDRLLQAREEA